MAIIVIKKKKVIYLIYSKMKSSFGDYDGYDSLGDCQ